ncbi:MAG: LPS export ABC transporter permease LptG [Sphingomonas sp.]|jgi:lipopolysaccharide export system permease protein
MKIAFFPSRIVAIYIARMFLVRTFAILAAVAMVLQVLDLLSESGHILAHQGNGNGQIIQYVWLRLPEIIAFLLPFAALLGTILTLSTLNYNSEVIALKASGMSAHQVLAPLIIASLGVAALSFAFNDRIVSRATATLNRWQKIEYAKLPIDGGDRLNSWVLDNGDLMQVATVHGYGNATQLHDVALFDHEGGLLRAITRSPRAIFVAGRGWRFDSATRFDVASGKQSKIGSVFLASDVRPDQFALNAVDGDGLSFGALRTTIQNLADAGRPTKALEGVMWHKVSAPLSAVLMPLLGAVAAFGIARSGKLFVRAVIGMALGFAYFVADNFALSMGSIGAYPPFLAAWAPFLLFLFIGELVLLRTEE